MRTRERIVEAAGRVMREKGLAQVTTKEITREAGFSEGTLYKHFESKEDLFLAVLAESLPSFAALARELPARAGRGQCAKRSRRWRAWRPPSTRRACP